MGVGISYVPLQHPGLTFLVEQSPMQCMNVHLQSKLGRIEYERHVKNTFGTEFDRSSP